MIHLFSPGCIFYIHKTSGLLCFLPWFSSMIHLFSPGCIFYIHEWSCFGWAPRRFYFRIFALHDSFYQCRFLGFSIGSTPHRLYRHSPLHPYLQMPCSLLLSSSRPQRYYKTKYRRRLPYLLLLGILRLVLTSLSTQFAVLPLESFQ